MLQKQKNTDILSDNPFILTTYYLLLIFLVFKYAELATWADLGFLEGGGGGGFSKNFRKNCRIFF